MNQGPRCVPLMEKSGGWISRAAVPLRVPTQEHYWYNQQSPHIKKCESFNLYCTVALPTPASSRWTTPLKGLSNSIFTPGFFLGSNTQSSSDSFMTFCEFGFEFAEIFVILIDSQLKLLCVIYCTAQSHNSVFCWSPRVRKYIINYRKFSMSFIAQSCDYLYQLQWETP
jgi:hypothetical protein